MECTTVVKNSNKNADNILCFFLIFYRWKILRHEFWETSRFKCRGWYVKRYNRGMSVRHPSWTYVGEYTRTLPQPTPRPEKRTGEGRVPSGSLVILWKIHLFLCKGGPKVRVWKVVTRLTPQSPTRKLSRRYFKTNNVSSTVVDLLSSVRHR